MNNYIPADKLLAEIQRRKQQDITIRERSILIDIETAITALQQEQPDNEDIDKVAQELYEHLYELKRRNNVPTNLYDKQEIINLWKAGIEYAYNHPKQEQADVELEEEITRWLEKGDITDTRFDNYDDSDIERTARHFFELGLGAGREKSNGVDGVVHHALKSHWIVTNKNKLAAILKAFPEGAEVELFITAKKEKSK
jgi:hypothetical protein